ncbi:MAG TPA: tRNA pseudouridine(55) synthase TruB [Thermomicrobiales bacterium]|nr:tRNA pseudouridine(55) synthase TruB [Thermomicrobiales bacterium]
MATVAPRSDLPDIHGLIVVDKPAGWTSHDVVARVRRLTGMKRVGHGGTLDPFATGVVVVAVGRATRVLQYIQDSDKRYLAHVVLGAETDTLDVDGEVVSRNRGESLPAREDVEAALAHFTGEIEQVPPAYSAIKVQGRRLYERARAGEAVVAPTRIVRIDAIDVLDFEPPDLLLDISCGKGTYIRSIARDLGARLGSGAYCHGLRRIRNGAFTVADAWTLDELDAIDLRGRWPEVATHPDRAVANLDAIILDGDQTEAWYHGRSVDPVTIDARPWPALLRVYTPDGRFAGIGRHQDDGALRPAFVFSASEEGQA